MAENKTEFRNLDGAYFRVQRDGKWKNICFSDLTEDEMEEVMTGRNIPWLKQLCKLLGQTLRHIGDECDIMIDLEEGSNG